ncbi:hypothetical protein ABZX69_35840 [Streptomyces sp. NPDC004074]|uniref:hypothetical protein n=1 Tax=Streptomyces sp. NPDC004074 TaxID=3154277 RepID=UPI0033B5AC6A
MIRRATRAPELAQYKLHLVEAAIELLEQGGLVVLRKTSKKLVFLAVRSDGSTTYRTARAACTCPAGLKAIHVCKHRIATHAWAPRPHARSGGCPNPYLGAGGDGLACWFERARLVGEHGGDVGLT